MSIQNEKFAAFHRAFSKRYSFNAAQSKILFSLAEEWHAFSQGVRAIAWEEITKEMRVENRGIQDRLNRYSWQEVDTMQNFYATFNPAAFSA